MSILIYLIRILCLLLVLTVDRYEGRNMIVNINERVQQFESCNIRITAEFESMELELFTVPVALLDTKNRKNLNFFQTIWKKKVARGINVLPFKYRGFICTFDLVIHLGADPFEQEEYWFNHYQWYEYMNDKYLVIIFEHIEEKRKLSNSRLGWDIPDHKIFIWTVEQRDQNTNGVYQYSFRDIFFACQKCGISLTVCDVIASENEIHLPSVKAHMDYLAIRFRKENFWMARRCLIYGKLGRGIKLPYDEEFLNRLLRTNEFYEFVQEMLYRSNASRCWRSVNLLGYQSVQHHKHFMNLVPEEVEGFNFITCATSDTFWSTAQLFHRPYQPFVWSALGLALLASGLLLLTIKVFGKLKFSLSKFVACFLFNLIEVALNPGKILRPLRILLVTWLLVSVILSNSYKSLLISYLSAPWAPEQDYDYFNQMMDFQFYSRVSRMDRLHIGTFVHGTHGGGLAGVERTNHAEKSLTTLVPWGSTFQEFRHLRAFPQNESKEISKKLISGGNVAVAGFNTEVDEIITEFRTEFKGIAFFRGKENMWSHNKNWEFLKISYSQTQIELVQMMVGGIYQFWKYWLRDRKYILLKVKDESDHASPSELSLNSNIFFVFIILIFGLLSSLSIFLTETLFYRFKNYYVRNKCPHRVPAKCSGLPMSI